MGDSGFFSEIYNFFLSIYSDWLTQSPATQIATALTLMVPLLGWIFSYSRLGLLRKANEGKDAQIKLEQTNNKQLQERLDKSEAELSSFETQFDPSDWLSRAKREQRDKNPELAQTILMAGFDNVRVEFAKVCHQIASHFWTDWKDRSSRTNDNHDDLRQAGRFVHISRLSDPFNYDVQPLADMVENACSEFGLAPFANSIELSPEEARAQLSEIYHLGAKLYEEGQYEECVNLHRQGQQIANRGGIANEHDGLVNWYNLTRALSETDQNELALSEIEELLPIWVQTVGEKDPNTLTNWKMKANILNRLGKYDQALAEINSLSVIKEQEFGKDHPETFDTKYLNATILGNMDKNQLAFSKIEKLEALEEKLFGKNHTETFALAS